MSGGTLHMRYNSINRRLQKKAEATAGGGVTTDYIRDQNGNVLAVYEDGTLVERYVWGPMGLVKILKGENGSTTPYFVINDHLGYVRTVVNAGGTAVAAYDYWPYDKSLRSSVDANAGSRFQFGAKEHDPELDLDLYYFEARFYDPEIGRFVNPDPLRVVWSYYSFVTNDPLNNADPSGYMPEPEGPPPPIMMDWTGGLPIYDSRKTMGTNTWTFADNETKVTWSYFGYWEKNGILNEHWDDTYTYGDYDWLHPEDWPSIGQGWFNDNKKSFKNWYIHTENCLFTP